MLKTLSAIAGIQDIIHLRHLLHFTIDAKYYNIKII